MFVKLKKSAKLISSFIITNIFMPVAVYHLGKDLYNVWEEKK